MAALIVAAGAALVQLNAGEAGDETAAAAPLVRTPEGRVSLIRNLDPAFGRIVADAGPGEMRFIREHFRRLRGFPPFGSEALSWSPPTDAYQDLYAIYNDRLGRPGRPDLDTLEPHPDWVLRDGDGNPLFIPFDCGGGECTQLAADPGNEEWRRDWIRRARARLACGYAGIYIDDVNLEWRVSDGAGEQVIPIDPRTSERMRLADWRRYVAEFTEQVRKTLAADFPQAVISHNALWFAPEDNRFVQRQVESADYIQMERGFNDLGIVGKGRFGFNSYLGHVDYLHTRGRGVIFKPRDLDRASREFEVAAYLLVSDGTDVIAPEDFAEPGSLWPGWKTDLGEAEGPRYPWKGVLRRDFSDGFVLVNPPDAPRFTGRLPEPGFRIDGRAVRRIELGARRAAVVRSAR